MEEISKLRSELQINNYCFQFTIYFSAFPWEAVKKTINKDKAGMPLPFFKYCTIKDTRNDTLNSSIVLENCKSQTISHILDISDLLITM